MPELPPTHVSRGPVTAPSPSKRKKLTRRERIGRAIARTAPQLAEALGGPLAGAAIGAIADAIIGDSTADESLVEQAILAAHPETLLKLRQADYDFHKAILASQTTAERIAMEDRASARARETALKDNAPTMIGTAVILGFFTVLGVMIFVDLPAGAQNEFAILLGALATMTAAVVNYFFGSSAGSKEKTQLLARQQRSNK